MLRPRQASGRVKIPKQKRNSQKTRLGKPCRVKFKGTIYADVAELADALDSGSSECKFMWVQVPSSAPKWKSVLERGRVFVLYPSFFIIHYSSFIKSWKMKTLCWWIMKNNEGSSFRPKLFDEIFFITSWHVGVSFVSFAPIFYKNRSALMSPLLLSAKSHACCGC